MKFIGFEREDEAIEWAKALMGIEGPTGFCRAMSTVDEVGGFVLVTVFSNFTPRNVDMQIAIADGGIKMTRYAFAEIFNAAFGYVFDRLGAARVTGLVRAKNVKARRFDEHLGFKLEGIMREAFEDDDLCVYGFLKSDFETNRWHYGRQR